jgi:hypothetical protein
MSRNLFWILINIGILVILTGCISSKSTRITDPALNGKWEGDPRIVEHWLENGVYEEYYDGRLQAKGTFTTKGKVFTINITHLQSRYLTNLFSNGWGNHLTWEEDMVCIYQARTELINQYIGMKIGWSGRTDSPELTAEAEAAFDGTFGRHYQPRVYRRYSIRGDTLALKHQWGTSYWHRKRESNIIETITIQYETANESDFEISVENNEVSIIGYKGHESKLNIPSEINGMPVTAIGREAFLQKHLESITIPNSVKAIGDEAFRGNRLTRIIIPDSVTDIGHSAFYFQRLPFRSEGLNAFFTLTYKGEVTITAYNGWGGDVIIPEKINGLPVVTIQDSAFSYCRVSKVVIPNILKIIGNRAFAGNSLVEVNIPASVTTIGHSAFSNNPLRNVSVPNSVISMGSQVFDALDLNPETRLDLERRFGEEVFVLE